MINLSTNFEVPTFKLYGDMKDVAKCIKWRGLGWLWVTHGHRQCHHAIEHIRLPIRGGRRGRRRGAWWMLRRHVDSVGARGRHSH